MRISFQAQIGPFVLSFGKLEEDYEEDDLMALLEAAGVDVIDVSEEEAEESPVVVEHRLPLGFGRGLDEDDEEDA